ncbi:hypothetical protein GCK72_023051 [Caenorhabditis remanei]|uniref:Serpentine receptor class gamma n=1 Tax=Caenorhabditis remanei TaxID=31234 RepID=A0A6A5FVR2_CAERE|nr:hypothetical protein GCK72_023051 [Caenorhabditis remanei]KAF1746594.1 hypothetical protein GCK72_023051 [Caenorhabditis remanei]
MSTVTFTTIPLEDVEHNMCKMIFHLVLFLLGAVLCGRMIVNLWQASKELSRNICSRFAPFLNFLHLATNILVWFNTLTGLRAEESTYGGFLLKLFQHFPYALQCSKQLCLFYFHVQWSISVLLVIQRIITVIWYLNPEKYMWICVGAFMMLSFYCGCVSAYLLVFQETVQIVRVENGKLVEETNIAALDFTKNWVFILSDVYMVVTIISTVCLLIALKVQIQNTSEQTRKLKNKMAKSAIWNAGLYIPIVLWSAVYAKYIHDRSSFFGNYNISILLICTDIYTLSTPVVSFFLGLSSRPPNNQNTTMPPNQVKPSVSPQINNFI